MTRLPIPAPVITRDPLWWQVGLAGLFAVLVFWHLGTPSKIYFDEVHYVARQGPCWKALWPTPSIRFSPRR